MLSEPQSFGDSRDWPDTSLLRLPPAIPCTCTSDGYDAPCSMKARLRNWKVLDDFHSPLLNAFLRHDFWNRDDFLDHLTICMTFCSRGVTIRGAQQYRGKRGFLEASARGGGLLRGSAGFCGGSSGFSLRLIQVVTLCL